MQIDSECVWKRLHSVAPFRSCYCTNKTTAEGNSVVAWQDTFRENELLNAYDGVLRDT
jgi:hypothetical protein